MRSGENGFPRDCSDWLRLAWIVGSPRALSTVAAAPLLPAFATGAAIALRDAQFQTLGCGSVAARSSGNRPTEGDDPCGFTKAGRAGGRAQCGPVDAGTAVTVNSVLPGPTRSDGVEAFLTKMAERMGNPVDEMAADFAREYRPTPLLQRFARVEEVANMVVYAASKEASATNGAALRVEGGIVQTIV